jgi:predicted nucleic acid-binding protein
MPVFVDTGAWFAYFVRRDPDHVAAAQWIRTNRLPLLTTDFVLDELFTLRKLRESHAVAVAVGSTLLDRHITKIERVSEGDFARAWTIFEQYKDKEWSFTDCTSKVVIERLSITYAFAFDSHFEQFGTVTRVP